MHRARPILPALLALALLAPATAKAQSEPPQPAAAAATTPVPLVVAVDTSRSLSPAELATAVDRLRLALAGLPGDVPAGLLVFDDRPRWVLRPGAEPAAVSAALEELTPEGDFTLLHDALFTAARELADGGVVLVATDGRDENSVTTVDDIARRYEAQGVRILTLGAGPRPDERLLRRLALVSDGAHLGDAGEVEAAALVRGISAAREAVAAERAAARSSPAAAGPRAEEPGAGPGERGERRSTAAEGATDGDQAPGTATLPGWVLPIALVALLALGLLLFARNRGRRGEPAESAGTPAADAARQPPQPVSPGLADTLAGREALPAAEAEEVTVDTAVFGADGNGLEQTRVLAERAVLMVTEPGEGPPRTFLLRADKAFSVGRDRERNTLAIPDPALSSQHFKIVPDEGRFYLLDLRSTNGTLVNGERQQIQELHSGDLIHAGQIECSFRSFTQTVG